MPSDCDQYDFFVSYARNDNADGWVTRFIAELLAEHVKFATLLESQSVSPFNRSWPATPFDCE